MGRKSSIDMRGLAERILYMANSEQKTIKQIVEELNREGIEVSTSAVQRKLKTSREAAHDFMAAIEESKALIDAVRSNPNTDVLEVTTTMLGRKIFEYVRDIEQLDFEDPAALTAALAKLATSQTHVAKLRLNYQTGFEDAKKAVLVALKDELKNHPDLLSQITTIVGSIRSKEG